MSTAELELMSHLMRRAGFGATRTELNDLTATGYENVVEDLLNPGEPNNLPDDIIRRFHADQHELRQLDSAGGNWVYRMATTDNPLEEKITLFWHGVFATGYSKLNQARTHLNQIRMLRQDGLGSFRDLLVDLSRDPAMIIWLDNNDNHKTAINENYGRELLELFSMGIGNYTEDDVKECARAFTGWTLKNAEYMSQRAMKDSIWPYGRISWHFEYRDEDHDDGEKTFLGETGNFDGEDVIDIIAQQDATARFVCTRLFQFFAADEVEDDAGPVIEEMMGSYFDSGYETRSVLRTLFNSDYFRSEKARFARVKGPVELVIGAVRQAGTCQEPTLNISEVASQAFYMGQGLLQPPTVEGWHEGIEWIDSGALVERVNFVARALGDIENPGVQTMIQHLATMDGGVLSADEFVDGCLELLGPIHVPDETRATLVEVASKDGDLDLSSRKPGDESEQRVGNMLRLAASTRAYQMA
jgi:uncharacterized protein (DUF1800 family)